MWLKYLQAELLSDNPGMLTNSCIRCRSSFLPDLPQPIKLNAELADRLLIARLEVDPDGMS